MSPTLREIMADDGYLDVRRDIVIHVTVGPTGEEIDDTGGELDAVEMGERGRRMVAGRCRKGPMSTRAIPPATVRAIYTAEHPYSVAAEHGVNQSQVRDILRGRTYSDVTESLTRWAKARTK